MLWREAIQFETRFGEIERSARDVHAHDFGALVIGQQPSEQLALTAAEVEHSCGTRWLRLIVHYRNQHVQGVKSSLSRRVDRSVTVNSRLGPRAGMVSSSSWRVASTS
jgi:hypothetical protein